MVKVKMRGINYSVCIINSVQIVILNCDRAPRPQSGVGLVVLGTVQTLIKKAVPAPVILT